MIQIVLGFALLAASPESPAEKTAADESYYLIGFRGQSIGKAERKVSRVKEDGEERLVLDVEENYVFSAGERSASQFSLRRKATMTSDWTPVTVTERSDESGGSPRSVRFEPGKAVFTLPDGKEKTVPFQGAAAAEISGEALLARGLLATGKKLTAVVPDLASSALVLMRAEVVGEKSVEGRTGKLFLVEVRDAEGKPIWDLLVDEKGRLEELSIGDLVRKRVERSEAVLPSRPAALAAGAIKLEGAPEKSWKMKRLEVELTTADVVEKLVPEVAGQRVKQSGRRVSVAVVARKPDGRIPQEDLAESERARWLRPEGEPDWRAPEVQKIATALTKNETSDLKKAYLVGRWTYRTLKKNLGGPPEASARQALAQGGGDCSEHAAVFAALSRAAGVPARTAWGLVVNGQELRFHVWSEFYAGGRWIPTDCALGRFGLPACYITLGYDRDEAGDRLFKLYAASRARVLAAEEEPEPGKGK